MNMLLHKFPIASRYLLAIVLFALALGASVLVNKGVVKQYVPYTAPLLLVLATWLLYKTERMSLKKIGLNVSLRNVSFLSLGILIGAIAFLGARYLRALYLGETFELSDSIDYAALVGAFYFILPQVATEELVFRGYLFKKTVSVSNVIIANSVFSILFMLIHVIDSSVLSNIGMILMLVVAIPIGHLLFATALMKSKTIYFPIGLHLGNNWATRHLVSNSSTGESIFYIPKTIMLDTWPSFIFVLMLFNGFFLLVTFVIWKWPKHSIFKFKKNV